MSRELSDQERPPLFTPPSSPINDVAENEENEERLNTPSIREIFGYSRLAAGFRYRDFSALQDPPRFLSENILTLPQQAISPRDEMWEEYIATVQEEINQSIVDKNNPELTQEEILISCAESWRDVAIAKIRTMFNIEDAEWELALGNYIYGNYTYLQGADPQNIADTEHFVKKLLEAAFYVSRNVDGVFVDQESLQDAYQKLKISFSTIACLGGAITSLESFCTKIKFPDFLWEDIKQKLATELEPFCYQGNQVHLLALLDYIFTGNIGEDRNIFAASSDIQFRDMFRLIEKVKVRASELVLFNIVAQYEDVILDVAGNNLKEYDQILKEFNNPDLSEEERAALQQQLLQKHEEIISHFIETNDLFDRLQNHHYRAVQNLRTTNPSSALEIRLENIPDADKARRFYAEIVGYIENSLGGYRDTDVNSEGRQQLVDLITLINSYAAKNYNLPRWLLDVSFGVLLQSRGRLVNQDLFNNLAQSRQQYIEHNYSAETAVNYEEILSLCLQDVVANLSDQTGISFRLIDFENEVLEFCQVNSRENLQDIISAGCNFDEINKYLEDHQELINQLQEGDRLNVDGLLFNPEQYQIIDLLKHQYNIPIDFDHAIKRALIVGDNHFVLNNLEEFYTYLRIAMREGELIPNLLSSHCETLFETLSIARPSVNYQVMFQAMMKCWNVYNDNFVSVFHNIVLQNSDSDHVFDWVERKFGDQVLVEHLSSPHNIDIAEDLLAKSSICFRGFIDRILRLSDNIENRGNLNNVINNLIVVCAESNFGERERAINELQNLLPENPQPAVGNPEGAVAANEHGADQRNLLF